MEGEGEGHENPGRLRHSHRAAALSAVCCTPIRSAHKQKERREQEAEKGAGTLRPTTRSVPTLAGPADQGPDPCGPLLFRPGLEATWKERGWSILLDTYLYSGHWGMHQYHLPAPRGTTSAWCSTAASPLALTAGSIAPCRGRRHMWWEKRSEKSGTTRIGKGASVNTDFDPSSFREGVPRYVEERACPALRRDSRDLVQLFDLVG